MVAGVGPLWFSMTRNRAYPFLSWNVRGLNDPAKCSTILAFVRNCKCSVICFQETKLSSVSAFKQRSFCGHFLKDFRSLDAEGFRGGLLTAWNPAVFECIRFWVSSYSLNVLFRRKAGRLELLVSNIYGPTCPSRKLDFFVELKAIKDQAPAVWVAMGDFNTLLSLNDKNGAPSSIPTILQFRAVINEIGLLDLPLLNRAYTWTNGGGTQLSNGWIAPSFRMVGLPFSLTLCGGRSPAHGRIIRRWSSPLSRSSLHLPSFALKPTG